MKRISNIRLFEIYRNLLTDRQQNYFEQYYFFDNSLSEIAELNSISKAAVSESIRKTELQLLSFEKKLQILAKEEKILIVVEKSNLKEEIISILTK